MKTREIKKAIIRLENNIINKYGVDVCVLRNTKKYRDMQGKFYSKHNFYFFVKGKQILIISDLYSTDLTFKKLKPQIKKKLGEHFGFLWRMRNLFR